MRRRTVLFQYGGRRVDAGRAGKRVDQVRAVWLDVGGRGTGASHGGDGGAEAILDGLDKDPVVRVELCSAKKDGKVRVGHIKFLTYSGRMQQGGGGYDNCHTIAPYGKALYGFYGRSGDEIDLLGTLWGDLPSGFPAKQTSW
ncbi:jacalin-like lectin [Sorangium sp. So ce429]